MTIKELVESQARRMVMAATGSETNWQAYVDYAGWATAEVLTWAADHHWNVVSDAAVWETSTALRDALREASTNACKLGLGGQWNGPK